MFLVDSSSDRASSNRGQSLGVRQWLALAGLLLFGISGFAGWRVWQARVAETAAMQLEAQQQMPEITTVTALGRLEPEGELINLTAPTAVQSGRIEALPVTVGDRVTPGQVIAVLDNRDRLQAALQKAERQVDIARANLAKIESGAQTGEVQAQLAEISRLEADQLGNVNTQQATISRIQAEVNTARADFDRYNQLFERGGISASDRDARRLTLTTAEQRLAEAQSTLSRIQSTSQQQISQAQATLNRIEEVRPVDVASATAEVNSAIASVAEAEANLDQAYVRSPRQGQILEIHTHPGETISSDGIVTLGQTQNMLAVAEVYQDDIAKIQPGQPATLTATVFDEALRGTVERIGLQVDRQQVVNQDPTANIDARVVDVYIRLDDDARARVMGLTNLQVTATIEFK